MRLELHREVPAFAAQMLKAMLVKCRHQDGVKQLRCNTVHDLFYRDGDIQLGTVLVTYSNCLFCRQLGKEMLGKLRFGWLEMNKYVAPDGFETWNEYVEHIRNPENTVRRWYITFRVLKFIVAPEVIEAITEKRIYG